MKKEIILLIGNIASGKSTIAKQYAKKGYVVISRDSLR
jgi:dephospho-CoA kinase